MSTMMTFNSLLEDIRNYIERGGPTDTSVYEQLPKLINDAERIITTDLKILGFQNSVTSILGTGQSVKRKPDRWRETISMEIGLGVSGNQRKFLFPRDYTYCRSYWPDSSQTDEPEFYSDYGYYNWLIVPTPVQDYNWQINYYQLPPLLSEVNQTNWLTDIIPQILRYRAMMEASPFLKADERLNTWGSLYSDGIAKLDQQDLERIADRTSTRSKD